MPSFIDLTGQRFERLTVLHRAPNHGAVVMWMCRCDCGMEKAIEGHSLRAGLTRSCGCLVHETGKYHRVDLTGRTFGRWTVLSFAGISKQRQTLWNCICACGAKRIVPNSSLQSGASRSCGCCSHIKHGHCRVALTGRKSPTYLTYRGMISRCVYPKNPSYPTYGGAGVKVCKRWLKSFKNFYRDMGRRPEGKTLGRFGDTGDYKPSNCKWMTPAEQKRERRKKHNKWYNTQARWGK